MAKQIVGMGRRGLSPDEEAEFEAFAKRASALGLTENPYRTGSWGTIVSGKFKEVVRIDVGELGKGGWRGRTHMHIGGGKDHHDPLTKLPGET